MAKKRITMERINNKNIDDAFKDFIKHCRVKNLADATIQFYEDCFYKFEEFYDGKLSDITKNVIDDYTLHLRQQSITNISINTYLRGLRAILYYFIKIGYIDKFKISLQKAEKQIKETYTDRELEILLKKPNLKECDFVEYRSWVVVNFLLGTGCRASTLCSIKIKDLQLESALIVFRKTKNKKQQIIPISNQLCLILQEYLTYRNPKNDDEFLFISMYSQKLNANSLRQSIANYNIRRGVTKTGVHLFRHTFAKMWIKSGGNMFSLQKILGHSNLEMVKEYVEIFGEDLRRDYDQFNPLEQFNARQHISLKRGR